MKKVPVYGIQEFLEEDRERFFYSNNLPEHLKSHQFVNLPHKHSTFISILFTKGKGEHQIDFDTFPVVPGAVFLLNPGQVHCWQLSKDVDGFVFIHTKEFYDSVFLKRKIEDFPFFFLQKNHPAIYLDTAQLMRIESIYKEINREFNLNLSFSDAKLGSLIDLLYIDLTRLYKKEEKTSDTTSGYSKVKKLQKLIDENFKIKKFPAEYADMMHMTTRHLSRICNDVLNISTGDLIADRIILEAKRLLIHNDASISSVADELGFEDRSYFIRLFKKKTGISPKQFQRKL